MAKMVNVGRNVFCDLQPLHKESISNGDTETWIVCCFSILTKAISFKITEEDHFTLLKDELLCLIKKMETMILCIDQNKPCSFGFSNIEYNISIEMETAYDPEITEPTYNQEIEVVIWIIIGTYTHGNDTGYDIGISFSITKQDLQQFKDILSEELESCLK